MYIYLVRLSYLTGHVFQISKKTKFWGKFWRYRTIPLKGFDRNPILCHTQRPCLSKKCSNFWRENGGGEIILPNIPRTNPLNVVPKLSVDRTLTHRCFLQMFAFSVASQFFAWNSFFTHHFFTSTTFTQQKLSHLAGFCLANFLRKISEFYRGNESLRSRGRRTRRSLCSHRAVGGAQVE